MGFSPLSSKLDLFPMHIIELAHHGSKLFNCSLISTESDTIPSDCQSNPAYIHFRPTENSTAGSLSGNHSENPAYNINTQQNPHEEPMYEVIPSDTDRWTPHTVQGAQNVHCDQNPTYIHVLGIHTEERLPTDQLPQCDYSQNPAYGIHSSSNNSQSTAEIVNVPTIN